MRLALKALFYGNRDDSDESVRKRVQLENELRDNERSAEFFRKLKLVANDPSLRAPLVFADESFPDANVVAEYLDCQIASSELATEYEEACLERPELLAEVGDCYDLLANRLLEPVEPPQNCRTRLYRVGWEKDVADDAGEEDPLTELDEPISLDLSQDDVSIDDSKESPKKSAKRGDDKATKSGGVKAKKEKKRARSTASKIFATAKIAVVALACVGAIRMIGAARRGPVVDHDAPILVDNGTESSGGNVGVSNFLEDGSEIDPVKMARFPEEAPVQPSEGDQVPELTDELENEYRRDPDDLRRGIEIPETNNDAFAKPLRY